MPKQSKLAIEQRKVAQLEQALKQSRRMERVNDRERAHTTLNRNVFAILNDFGIGQSSRRERLAIKVASAITRYVSEAVFIEEQGVIDDEFV